MKPAAFAKSLLTIMILLISCWPATTHGGKEKTLQQKLREISLLRVKIIDKIDQAAEMRSHLERQLAELRREIRAEQMRAEIYSRREALQNLRIRYNLNLIQTLQAYITALHERIDYFRNGNERLKFLAAQINDDLAIVTVLKDMEIETLIKRVNAVLNEFVPETQKQIFNAAQIRLPPIEHVWRQICARSRPKQPYPKEDLVPSR